MLDSRVTVDKLKLKYFFYHLIASLSIVVSFSLICQFFWFPSPFLILDGTWIALVILASIDIIIGPLFTLFLVSSKKKFRENLFDLLIILTVQIAAFSYGLLQISQERIYALIYLNGAFNPIPIKEIPLNKQKDTLSLPKYKGIYYGTSLHQVNKQNNSIPLLFSPENYKIINSQIIGSGEFSYNKLPLSVQKSYGDEYIFKVLPGKQGVGVVVLDQKLKIKDIVLL